jgi:hypothetical protein
MIVVLVGMGMAKGDSTGTTSESIHFHTRRTGLSDITTTTQSHFPRPRHRDHRDSRRHTQPADMDLDLDTLPTARAITLPGGDDWPLGNKGHSLDVGFTEQGDRSTRTSAATTTTTEKEKGRLSGDQVGRAYYTRRAEGSSSALEAGL